MSQLIPALAASTQSLFSPYSLLIILSLHSVYYCLVYSSFSAYRYFNKYFLALRFPSTTRIFSSIISFKILFVVESAKPNKSLASLFVIEPFSDIYFVIISFLSTFYRLFLPSGKNKPQIRTSIF